MVGLNGKAQQNPENGLFIINGECANIQDICKTRRARNGSLFYSSTVYFKKSTVHYIGKNKRDVISDNTSGKAGKKMEFNNKLYELRKQKGLSQEELAGRLNVSRQTVSKWEVGESSPDMEKLVAISELFETSLDELVLDKASAQDASSKQGEIPEVTVRSGLYTDIKEHVLTEDNKKKAKKGLKIAGIVFGAIVLVDLISMIVYFCFFGVPK